ncbi:hypothetical protein L7F22_001665 [Adiantum nelumboides]|nr:hypothetical protein [Adiantum nelumboides]
MTQCDAQSKKNKSINLYAGIFDNKLFRRGGRGSHCGSRPDSDRCQDDANTFNKTRPAYLAEGAFRDKYATVGFKHQFATRDDNASERNCQSHAADGQGSLQCYVQTYLDSRKEPCLDHSELKALSCVGTAEIDEHDKAIHTLNKNFSIHVGKAILDCSARPDRTECTSCHSTAGHNSQESKVTHLNRESEILERTNVRGNGLFLAQQLSQRGEDLYDSFVPSTLPGKLCKKAVDTNHVDCTHANTLLEVDETLCGSIQTAELLDTSSSASNDEICSLERRLGFTAMTVDRAMSGNESAGLSHSFSFQQSNVDTRATGMLPGIQCDKKNGEPSASSGFHAELNDFVLPSRNMIQEDSMAHCGNNLFVDPLKSEVGKNDMHTKDRSKLQGVHPRKTYCSGEVCSIGFTKTSKSGEHEPFGKSDTNGLDWKMSSSRGNSVLESPTRIGETISLDSLSSYGGSSSSGSPLAPEALKESRLSSPGDILISKGSPYSQSSRSMGSITGYDMAVNALLSPTSSNESVGQHWQSNARRSDEMMLSRVRNGNYDLKGVGNSRRVKADGLNSSFATSGNSTKRCQSLNANCHGNVLHSGNLLVGGANGDVLSYTGSTKGNAKQGRLNESTVVVDCKLLKRALATSDAEHIKNAGNEYFKAGHFSEALTLYDKAVALCPNNAVYRCNRAAALSGLERLGEAVKECEEAIRLDPLYARAQQRAASLYIRLGMIEAARQHLHDARQDPDSIESQRLQVIERHLFRCIEARKLGDWHNVIKESDAAVVAGADSAPQIFGFKAEALLRLQKLQHADSLCNVAQKIETLLIDLSIGSSNAYLCLTRVEVNMALGRFEEAVLAAEVGARLEPNNAIATAFLKKARTVAQARATGNAFFNAGRLFEALASYAEGLESDPTNAVLLCNRAACRLRLGQWEKAVEDCDAVLKAQPNYTKARLRRASCLTKLERWEDALHDYEILKREWPGNPEVDRALFDVQVAIKKSRGEEIRGMKFGGDVEEVTSEEQFREAVGSAGLSVVQFMTRWSDRCQELSPFIDGLCRRYPCVNFVKVDVEELPYLARIESITFIPTFKIYKDGQKLKEIIGPSHQSLEYAVSHYSL